MTNWEKVEMASAWDFDENPEFVGTYLGIEEEVGPNNSNLYHFKTRDGQEVAIWGSRVLDARFKSLEIGEEVKVTFLGIATSPKTGRKYKDFEVYRRKPDQEGE